MEFVNDNSVFSTSSLEARHQFDAWRDAVADFMDVMPADEPIAAFPAEHRRVSFAGLTLTRSVLYGAPKRAWRHSPHSSKDHWSVVVSRRREIDDFGCMNLMQNASFRSLALPASGVSSHDEVLALWIPREQLGPRNAALDRVDGRQILDPLGGVICDFLVSLTKDMPCLASPQGEAMADVIKSLVVACVTAEDHSSETLADRVSSTLMERAKHIIRQNFVSASLGPPMLFRTLGMSRSKLYRLFSDLGGVAALIQRERLLHSYHLLSDPSETRPISSISNMLRFSDHSAFCRAFKREFGETPSEARALALARRCHTSAGG